MKSFDDWKNDLIYVLKIRLDNVDDEIRRTKEKIKMYSDKRDEKHEKKGLQELEERKRRYNICLENIDEYTQREIASSINKLLHTLMWESPGVRDQIMSYGFKNDDFILRNFNFTPQELNPIFKNINLHDFSGYDKLRDTLVDLVNNQMGIQIPTTRELVEAKLDYDKTQTDEALVKFRLLQSRYGTVNSDHADKMNLYYPAITYISPIIGHYSVFYDTPYVAECSEDYVEASARINNQKRH